MPFKNLAFGVVATAPSPKGSGTSLTLSAGHAARFPDSDLLGKYFCTACPPGVDPDPDNSEIIGVTGDNTTTDVLTITRHERGSSAKNIDVGWKIYQGIYVEDIATLDASGLVTQAQLYLQNSIFRQALTNADFKLWQEGATRTTPNDDVYVADVFNALQAANGAWSFSQSTDVPAGVGAAFSLKAVNVTLNKQCALVFFLENKDALAYAGRAASLTFYAKTTTGKVIDNLRATLLSWNSTADVITSDVVGTWAGAGTDPTWATNWTAEAAGVNKALTNAWQKFVVENVVIDTANMTNLALIIWVDDTTIAAGDEFYITALGMNEGVEALPFMPKSIRQEVEDCQRFFEKSYDYGTAMGTNTPNGAFMNAGLAGNCTVGDYVYIFVPYKTKKRTAAAVGTYDKPGTYGKCSLVLNTTAYADGITVAGTIPSENGFALYAAATAAGQRGVLVHYTADARL